MMEWEENNGEIFRVPRDCLLRVLVLEVSKSCKSDPGRSFCIRNQPMRCYDLVVQTTSRDTAFYWSQRCQPVWICVSLRSSLKPDKARFPKPRVSTCPTSHLLTSLPPDSTHKTTSRHPKLEGSYLLPTTCLLSPVLRHILAAAKQSENTTTTLYQL